MDRSNLGLGHPLTRVQQQLGLDSGRPMWERPMPETPKAPKELTPWQKAAQAVIKMDRDALEFLKDK